MNFRQIWDGTFNLGIYFLNAVSDGSCACRSHGGRQQKQAQQGTTQILWQDGLMNEWCLETRSNHSSSPPNKLSYQGLGRSGSKGTEKERPRKHSNIWVLLWIPRSKSRKHCSIIKNINLFLGFQRFQSYAGLPGKVTQPHHHLFPTPTFRDHETCTSTASLHPPA